MPRLDFWFRLFHHAALGAGVGLPAVRRGLLPADPLLLALYLLAGLQVLAFGADGRRWVLPGWAANLLAGAVAGGGAAWIVLELNSARLRPGRPAAAGRPAAVHRPHPHRPARRQAVPPPHAARLLAAARRRRPPGRPGLRPGHQPRIRPAVRRPARRLRRLRPGLPGLAPLSGGTKARKGAPPSAADRLPFAYRMAPFCLRWALAVGGRWRRRCSCSRRGSTARPGTPPP